MPQYTEKFCTYCKHSGHIYRECLDLLATYLETLHNAQASSSARPSSLGPNCHQSSTADNVASSSSRYSPPGPSHRQSSIAESTSRRPPSPPQAARTRDRLESQPLRIAVKNNLRLCRHCSKNHLDRDCPSIRTRDSGTQTRTPSLTSTRPIVPRAQEQRRSQDREDRVAAATSQPERMTGIIYSAQPIVSEAQEQGQSQTATSPPEPMTGVIYSNQPNVSEDQEERRRQDHENRLAAALARSENQQSTQPIVPETREQRSHTRTNRVAAATSQTERVTENQQSTQPIVPDAREQRRSHTRTERVQAATSQTERVRETIQSTQPTVPDTQEQRRRQDRENRLAATLARAENQQSTQQIVPEAREQRSHTRTDRVAPATSQRERVTETIQSAQPIVTEAQKQRQSQAPEDRVTALTENHLDRDHHSITTRDVDTQTRTPQPASTQPDLSEVEEERRSQGREDRVTAATSQPEPMPGVFESRDTAPICSHPQPQPTCTQVLQLRGVSEVPQNPRNWAQSSHLAPANLQHQSIIHRPSPITRGLRILQQRGEKSHVLQEPRNLAPSSILAHLNPHPFSTLSTLPPLASRERSALTTRRPRILQRRGVSQTAQLVHSSTDTTRPNRASRPSRKPIRKPIRPAPPSSHPFRYSPYRPPHPHDPATDASLLYPPLVSRTRRRPARRNGFKAARSAPPNERTWRVLRFVPYPQPRPQPIDRWYYDCDGEVAMFS